MTLLLMLLACQNRPPEILSFNGEQVERAPLGGLWVDEIFFFEPGETVDLWVEVRDPDGDEVGIWFANAPPGLSFDSGDEQGIWAVPEDFHWREWRLQLIVVDDAPQPAGADLPIWFVNR